MSGCILFSNPRAEKSQTELIEIDNKQNQVIRGDVLFTTSSETPEEVGMSSIWLDNAANIYLNSFCFGFRPSHKFDLNFLAYSLRSPSVRRNIVLLAQGISRYNISKTKMMDLTILFPDLNEQSRIGLFLVNVDNLITLHQRRCGKEK